MTNVAGNFQQASRVFPLLPVLIVPLSEQHLFFHNRPTPEFASREALSPGRTTVNDNRLHTYDRLGAENRP